MLIMMRENLINGLENNYKLKNAKDVTDELLSIHGLRINDIDVLTKYNNLLYLENINDVSIDGNANKEDKTVELIFQESINSLRKVVGYDNLYKEMVKLYGEMEANRLLNEVLDLSLAVADSTKIDLPYCYGIDASRLVLEGRNFGQLHSKPCRRVSSYISSLCETVHQLSNHLAGAIAMPSFFFDIARILNFTERKNDFSLDDFKDEVFLKYIENEYQQFIHSLNHLSRTGNESPFSNISVFDRVKINQLINSDFMLDFFLIDSEEKKKKIIDYIIYLEKEFLIFFSKGDPCKGGIPYRFPVVEINFAKIDGKIFDESFLNWCCGNLDMSKFNIFISDGVKLCSCCRLISDREMLESASSVNSFGSSSISLGSHRVVTINLNRIALEFKYGFIDDFFVGLKQRVEDSIKILKAHKELLKDLEKRGVLPFFSNGWFSLNRMFSTVGILGYYEASNLLGIDIKDILITLNKNVLECAKRYNLICNIEQIPGETMAIKLYKVDKLLFSDDEFFNKNIVKMYSNQFIPLWDKDLDVWERLSIDGELNKLLTGGGIVHITIGENINGYQMREVINYAVECGCEHFAINTVYSVCENGCVIKGRLNQCVCGGEIKEWITRVVGFFTNVKNWLPERREEFWERSILKINKRS